MNHFSKQRRVRFWRNARFNSFHRCTQISMAADTKGNLRRTRGDENGDGGSCGVHRRKAKREAGRIPSPPAVPYGLFLSPPPVSPKFRAHPPVSKQVRGARISGRRRLQRRWRVHLGCFIYFLVQRIFTSDDDCKASLIPVLR
jgi:hypothetical protein